MSKSAAAQLFPDQRAAVDPAWRDVFDELVGRGCKPSVVQATIDYVSTDISQADAAAEYGVSRLSVRNLQDTAVDRGPAACITPTTRKRVQPADNQRHRDPDTLHRLYWDEGLTQAEIAAQFGVHVNTIWEWMNRHDIETRHRGDYA